VESDGKKGSPVSWVYILVYSVPLYNKLLELNVSLAGYCDVAKPGAENRKKKRLELKSIVEFKPFIFIGYQFLMNWSI
jgi:hypothetical protein